MAGWFELSKHDTDRFSSSLKARNSEVILRSEQYQGKRSAANGIAAVQANSATEARCDRKVSAMRASTST